MDEERYAEIAKRAIHEVLDERNRIDQDTHHADHLWVRSKREREQNRERRRQEQWDKVRASVIGAVLIAIVLSAGSFLYNVGKFVIDAYQKGKIQQ